MNLKMSLSLVIVTVLMLCYGEARLHGEGEQSADSAERELQSYEYTNSYTKPFKHFNKIHFQIPELAASLLPLEQYPLTDATASILKTQSDASSPMTRSDFSGNISRSQEIWELGGFPSFPGEDDYWEDLKEVVEAQILRRNNGEPPFTLPEIWKDFSISEVAEAVNNEYPGYWQSKLLQSFWSQGMKMDYSIMPFLSNVDFVGNTIRCAGLNTWTINEICPPTFLLKWTVGRIRPEEAAFQITKELLHNVPSNLKRLIKSMNLQTPEEFTAYAGGSPNHPSWPAMHSTASTSSLWLATVADLTEEQYCQALRMDYAVAFARTVAGVHYPSDNIAGLNFGQRLVALALPKHLAEEYGANEAAAREKVRKLRFNWATFDPKTCTVVYNHTCAC